MGLSASFLGATVMPSRSAIQMTATIADKPLSGRAYAETMPGITAPLGFFDPLGFMDDKSPAEIRIFREAELAHGRVSMIAALGFLVQENFHPIFPDIGGPAARQLDEVLKTENGEAIMLSLLFGIWTTEIYRARIGWKDPSDEMQALRDDYTPGDIGFDPLGMTSDMSEADLLTMRNKELNNGRLAMIAVAGICAQEVVSGTELLGSALSERR